jgi:hypothetical protein
MLNKINLVLFLLLITGSLFAQKSIGIIEFPSEVSAPLTNAERLQLLEVFGDGFNKLVLENPTQLQNLKFLLRSRIKIISTDKDDLSEVPKLSDLELFDTYNKNLQRPKTFDPSNFNPLIYQFQWYSPTQQIYHINNTDLLLQIIPQHAFIRN